MASGRSRPWIPGLCATCQFWSLSTEGGSRCVAPSQGPDGSRFSAVGARPESDCAERKPVEWSKTLVQDIEERYQRNPSYFKALGVTPEIIESMKRPRSKPSPPVAQVAATAPAKRPPTASRPTPTSLPTSPVAPSSSAPKLAQAVAGKRPPAAATKPTDPANTAQTQPPKIDPRRRPPSRPKP
jgi:hypothetical protein